MCFFFRLWGEGKSADWVAWGLEVKLPAEPVGMWFFLSFDRVLRERRADELVGGIRSISKTGVLER